MGVFVVQRNVEPVPGRQLLSGADLLRLALLEFNGRQIKNVVKTARLLPAKAGTPLSIEHIRTVLRVKGYDYGLTLEEERATSSYLLGLSGGLEWGRNRGA